jgi:hypothetical protein
LDNAASLFTAFRVSDLLEKTARGHFGSSHHSFSLSFFSLVALPCMPIEQTVFDDDDDDDDDDTLMMMMMILFGSDYSR